MTEITAKENWLRALNGEIPVNVPRYTMGLPGYKGYTAVRSIGPNLFGDTHHSVNGGTDIWGVHYITNEETNYGIIPEPNNFLLKDISDWESVIIAPEIPDVDWEVMAKKDYELVNIDRTQSAVSCNVGFSPFQELMALMGFTNGCCTLFEKPKAVLELLNYMADFYVPIIEKTLDYYKPDMLCMADDTASKYSPFISYNTFKTVFLPIYKKLAKPANRRGIPIHFHNCGKCEIFLDDLVKLGVKSWDPAQDSNNLLAIKEKYKGKLLVCGGFDWQNIIPNCLEDVSEEEIRQIVRNIIDKYAPGGGFAWAGSTLGKPGDKLIEQINFWKDDEFYNYGMHYYER